MDTVLILNIGLSLIITVAVYLAYPLLLIYRISKLTEKQITKVAIWNSVIVYVIFTVIQIVINGEPANMTAAVTWGFIVRWLLKRYCLKKDDEENAPNVCDSFEDYKQSDSVETSEGMAVNANGSSDLANEITDSDIEIDEMERPKSNVNLNDGYMGTQEAYTHKKKVSKGKKILAFVCVIVSMVILCGVTYYIGYCYGDEQAHQASQKEIDECKKEYSYLVIDYAVLEDKYDELIDKYNTLVDKYNTLLDEYNSVVKQKEEYDAFETLTFSGTGNSTIKGINAPEGAYYITTKHSGNSNCYAHFYENMNSYGPLIANFVGKGSEVYGYEGSIKNGYINITADGKWTITIEKAK